MAISKDQGELTSRGEFPDLSSRPIAHGGRFSSVRPTYAAAGSDYQKEIGWDLMDILEAFEDWQQSEISDDSVERLVRVYRNKPYLGNYEPNPLGQQTAIRASSAVVTSLFHLRDEDSYENQSESILALDEYVAHLSALAASGILDAGFYKKGYKSDKYRSNPVNTDNSELLNAMFKIITAYRTVYAGFMSNFSSYSPRNLQTYFISPAVSALANAARTNKGSFLLSESSFPDAVCSYLSQVTKIPDNVSNVESNLFYAKATLAEMIGGGIDSPFWYESMFEEVTASFTDDDA